MDAFNSLAIRISHAKFHSNRLTTVQDIQDYVCLIFLGHTVHDMIIMSVCYTERRTRTACQCCRRSRRTRPLANESV